MKKDIRVAVVIPCLVLIVLSAAVLAIKHGYHSVESEPVREPLPDATWTPPTSGAPNAHKPGPLPGYGEKRAWQAKPAKALKRSKVLLSDGSVVSIRGSGMRLGAPGVIAELYDGAPPEAVERLHHILASGSNEYAEFVRTEKYPPEVYEKMRTLVPGELGELLVWLAQRQTALDPVLRAAPVMDWSDGDNYVLMRIGDAGEIPVGETRFGTVWADRNALLTPTDLAVWMAHRIAAGDTELRLPPIPPKGFQNWESWVWFHLTESGSEELEHLGLLPKRIGSNSGQSQQSSRQP